MRHSVLVFICAVEPLQVLLLKRTAERGGWWQPVTGHVEPGSGRRRRRGGKPGRRRGGCRTG
ncbi:Dihydroneopterin triphosphate diphosphatase (fragment) [Kyrpidia spormannii]|uniref:Dihydroneopterin triphosphate diphosphatase n=1 Tax=Kyrpidia spormannii TaxID=2055160 RepID=A0ACA8ZAD0_9BACL